MKPLLILFAILFPLFSFSLDVGKSYYSGSANLKLRKLPNVKLEDIGTLTLNDQVVIQEDKGEFAKVKVLVSKGPISKTKEFYVLSKYLSASIVPHVFFMTQEDLDKQPYRVEFFIGDLVPVTRMWGHSSLRVVGGGEDYFYDFGRYGKMWEKDALGDPILRVWKKNPVEYLAYHMLIDGGVTTRVVFESTAEINKKINDHVKDLIAKGKPYNGPGRNSTVDFAVNYKIPEVGEFNAAKNNCTTFSADLFEVGFPSYNLHQKAYMKGRDFFKIARYMDMGLFTMNANSIIWNYFENDIVGEKIAWPLDLLAELEDKAKQFSELLFIERWGSREGKINFFTPSAVVYKRE